MSSSVCRLPHSSLWNECQQLATSYSLAEEFLLFLSLSASSEKASDSADHLTRPKARVVSNQHVIVHFAVIFDDVETATEKWN